MKTIITNEVTEPRYYQMMPHIADDELDIYEYRLYGHYRRVAGQEGKCWESAATTAKKCGMSRQKMLDTRKSLQDKGYIKLTQRKKGKRNQTTLVRIVNIWQRNNAHIASKGSLSGRQGVVYQVDKGSLPDRPKEETVQEETVEELGSASAAQDSSPPKEPKQPQSVKAESVEREDTTQADEKVPPPPYKDSAKAELCNAVCIALWGKSWATIGISAPRAKSVTNKLHDAGVTIDDLRRAYRHFRKLHPNVQFPRSPEKILDHIQLARDANTPQPQSAYYNRHDPKTWTPERHPDAETVKLNKDWRDEHEQYMRAQGVEAWQALQEIAS